MSQACGLPCSNPVVSHCWRWADVPCVNDSGGLAVPVTARCRKSSPTTAAARSASAKSAWVSAPRRYGRRAVVSTPLNAATNSPRAAAAACSRSQA